jgi:hypothetical protein
MVCLYFCFFFCNSCIRFTCMCSPINVFSFILSFLYVSTHQLLLAPSGGFLQLLELGVGVMHPRLQHGPGLATHRRLLHGHAD